jgi:anti-sigma regulatory factor (Ser/Thr protein kinase)
MDNVFSIGFPDTEKKKLQNWLLPLGYNLQAIEGNPLQELRKITLPHPIFINLLGEIEIELLKKLLTDFDTHVYVCGIALDKRKELFNITPLKEVILFFLPLEEKEIRETAALIRQKFKNRKIKKELFEGLHKIEAHFEWDTRLINVSYVSREVAALLYHAGLYTGTLSMAHVNLALEEALTNSIEHGNLELDSSLKPNSMFEVDQYESLKKQRMDNPQYSSRKIKLYLFISPTQAEIHIIDEGPGFEISILNKNKDQVHTKIKKEQIWDISGKGLTFIRKAFDNVEYKDSGREIILIKKR